MPAVGSLHGSPKSSDGLCDASRILHECYERGRQQQGLVCKMVISFISLSIMHHGRGPVHVQQATRVHARDRAKLKLSKASTARRSSQGTSPVPADCHRACFPSTNRRRLF